MLSYLLALKAVLIRIDNNLYLGTQGTTDLCKLAFHPALSPSWTTEDSRPTFSNLFSTILTEGAVTTEAGSLLQYYSYLVGESSKATSNGREKKLVQHGVDAYVFS